MSCYHQMAYSFVALHMHTTFFGQPWGHPPQFHKDNILIQRILCKAFFFLLPVFIPTLCSFRPFERLQSYSGLWRASPRGGFKMLATLLSYSFNLFFFFISPYCSLPIIFSLFVSCVLPSASKPSNIWPFSAPQMNSTSFIWRGATFGSWN